MKFVHALIGNPKTGKEEARKVTGKLIDNGNKLVVAIEDGKNFIVKVVPVLEDTIIEVIEAATPLFNQLIKLFDSLFRRLPTHIDYLGNVYRLTIQPAYAEMPDKVFYLIEKEKKGADKILFNFITEDAQLIKAKNKIRSLLKGKGLIS